MEYPENTFELLQVTRQLERDATEARKEWRKRAAECNHDYDVEKGWLYDVGTCVKCGGTDYF